MACFANLISIENGFVVEIQFTAFNRVKQLSLFRYGIRAFTITQGDFSFFAYPEKPSFCEGVSDENNIVFHRQVFSRVVGDKIWRMMECKFSRDESSNEWMMETDLID